MPNFVLIFTTLLPLFTMSQKVGNQRDPYGCNPTAGYVYSTIRQKCIRIFEEKIKLESTDPNQSYKTITCVIFDSAHLKAEVYIPSIQPQSIILDKVNDPQTQKWTRCDLTLCQTPEGYLIQNNAQILYRQIIE